MKISPKILCFDTESSACFNGERTPDEKRQYFKNVSDHRFDCAMTVNLMSQQRRPFVRDQVWNFAQHLREATLLVSHSGKEHDFFILEYFVGIDVVNELRQIPHYDHP